MAENFDKIITEEYAGLPAVKDPVMQKTLKTVIDNTIRNLNEAVGEGVVTGDVDQYTPVLISLIRRTLPTLVGPQMVGMQAMNLPTGRIFVQRIFQVDKDDRSKQTEIWANGTVGEGTAIGQAPDSTFSGPFSTVDGEKLAGRDFTSAPQTDLSNSFLAHYPELTFGIESMDVSVKTRALKGRLTTEVIQDLRSVHGLDAEQEIANILQTEITAEIDRELVSRIISEAKWGALECTTPGTFNFSTDADGRWSMEKVMGLLIQIEREATLIAQETRRGRGNFILTSPEVASYLSMANLITHIYGNTGFTQPVNPVGVSYYGMLCNRFKVFVDPYMSGSSSNGSILHTVVVGYKGTTQYDAGMFYCPYIPVAFYKSQDPDSFGASLAIKSRYGIVSNPYMSAKDVNNHLTGTAAANTNSFYRKFCVVF